MSRNQNVDKLRPNDSRFQFRSAHLNGRCYGYLYSTPPPGTPNRGTIILIHGFPDISFGWRYQIPFLISLGLTCIAPDCMGYGRTDAPPHTLADYGYRRISDDMAELCRQLGLSSIILGGHDWGGAIVYRIAQYYPKLISALFSVCTPYFPPSAKYEPLDILVQKRLPNFKYQCHFVSGEVEERVSSRAEIRGFLNGMYGARGPNRETGFKATEGVYFDNLPKLGANPLLSAEEMDYYTQEYSRTGMHGPLNWYRNREVNYIDEWKAFFGSGKSVEAEPRIEQEVLFILATKDEALRPFMAEKMGERIPRLTRDTVESGHWALWQRPEEVNGLIGRWLDEKVFNGGKASGASKL